MPNILTRLKINEVSSVDRGAGEGVRVVFSKRWGDGFEVENLVAKVFAANDWQKPIDSAAVAKVVGADTRAQAEVIKRVSEVQEYWKREFSDKERQDAADKGHALPDGSFLINDVQDLKNAIHAFGRAKDKAKAKAHIIARARALGQADLIPDNWTTKKSWVAKVMEALKLRKVEAVDFDEAHEATEAAEYAQGMMEEIQEAVCDLQASITSIMCDDELADKQAALATTFDQFKACIQTTVPEWMEKSLTAAGIAAAMAKGVPDMTTQVSDAVKKLLNDPVAIAALMAKAEESEKKREEDAKKHEKALRIAKMSEKHQAYHAQLDGAEKEKFGDMEPAERDAHMEKHPIEKRVIDALPESVRKSLEAGNQAMAILKKQEEEKDGKDAEDKEKALKLPAGTAKVLAKSLRDPAVSALLAHVATLNKQVDEGALFKNFGSNRANAGGTALEQLWARADEFRKTAEGKGLTREQAFAKVYSDPANAEVVSLHKRETAVAA